MAVTIVKADITTLSVDVVVNAANSGLLGGGGVDGAIHAAGGPAILAECQEIRRTQLPDGLPTGQAVATTAGELPARWVVHTVGPVWSETDDRSTLLHDCYENSLKLVRELDASSVAFPLISAGVYGWPLADAAQIAVSVTTREEFSDLEIALVAFGEAAFACLEIALSERKH